jgi:polysaccharide pyruvyl transferase WcaK-like protein
MTGQGISKSGIYLYGYYGQGNLGDDLLMASAVMMIRAAAPDAPLYLHCHDTARVPELGLKDVYLVPASAILADTTRSKPARMAAYLGLLRTTFGACRALIFGGGTVLQEGGSPFGLMVILVTVMQAKKRGLKVIAIGAGIGAARTRLGRFLLRRIIKRIDVLCLRDASSIAAAEALVPGKPVRAVADLVYALPPPVVQPSQGAPRAIFSIQPAVTARRDAVGKAVRAALAHTIAAFVARGWHCTLLAFETKLEGATGLDDREAWQDVVGDLLAQHPAAIELLAPSGDLATVTARMAGARVHVGQRYHGHVLAAVANVPFVGLAHDRKIAEVCRSFGMPCIAVESVTPEALLAMADDAATRTINPAVMAALRAEAHRNAQALCETLP